MHQGNSGDLNLTIEYTPIASLKDNPLNPRLHPASQIKALARSIKQFGFVIPVIIDKDGMLVCGHGRVEAARSVGLETVPAVRLEHLSPAQQRALMLADNKLGDLSSFDEGLLAQNFKLLEAEGFEFDLGLTGFVTPEIDLLLAQPAQTDRPDPDDEIENPDVGTPVNQVGDIWQLGAHRLACGSALEAEVWSALMAGEKAVMSISDVPYNLKVPGMVSGLGAIKHANFVQASGEMDHDEFTEFLETVFRLIARHSVSGSLHYAFIDWRHQGEMLAAGEAAFTELKNTIVWDKANGGPGGGMGSMYRSAHELINLWKSGRGKHIQNVDLGKWGRSRSNIWRYPGIKGFRHSDEGDLLALHATPKPVRLIADAMLDASRRGDLVLDAFLGSGTAIIAAERVGRRCFGCELDPKFADVIVHRFQRHSGEPAIHLPSGRTFAELADERGDVEQQDARHG